MKIIGKFVVLALALGTASVSAECVAKSSVKENPIELEYINLTKEIKDNLDNNLKELTEQLKIESSEAMKEFQKEVSLSQKSLLKKNLALIDVKEIDKKLFAE